MSSEHNPTDEAILQDPTVLFEEQPTPAQKALYDKFVDEYVKDFNGVAAATRCGFNVVYAKLYAPIFLGKSYVQRKVMEAKHNPRATLNDQEIKARVEAAYLAAIESGDPKAAVAAAKNLAAMRGVDVAPDKKGDELEKVVRAFRTLGQNLPD